MFSLAVYSVSTSEIGGKKIDLSNISGGQSFISFVQKYFQESKRSDIEIGKDRMMRIGKTYTSSSGQVFCGYIETGEFGFESEIYNTEKKSLSHRKQKQETELLPFFFMFVVPKKGEKAILVLQRFKQYGVRKFLGSHMREYYRKAYNGRVLEVRRVTPTAVLDTLTKDGLVKTIRFIQNKLPSDIADAVSRIGADAPEATAEIIVKAKRDGGFSFPSKFREILSGKRNFSQITELSSIEFDAIKLEIEINGSRRTVDIGSPGKFVANIDIDDHSALVLGKNGHPTLKSLYKLSSELATDVATAMKISIEIGTL